MNEERKSGFLQEGSVSEVGMVGWFIVVLVALLVVVAAYTLSQLNQPSISDVKLNLPKDFSGATKKDAQDVGPELSESTDLKAIEEDLNATDLESLDRELDEIDRELDF